MTTLTNSRITRVTTHPISACSRLTAIGFSAIAVVTPLTATAGPEMHADYVVIGKSINHRQTGAAELGLLNTVLFAEVFETEIGGVSNAVLRGPGEAAEGLPFSGEGIHFLAGERQQTIEALTKSFPDTTYFFEFDTPAGRVRELPATFERDAGEMRNPGPIVVSLYQREQVVSPGGINPDLDLTVRWSAFEKGAADPDGIIDDMIYVIVGDCLGEEIDHSGHAISNPDALTYRATEYVIDAAVLAPGRTYQLEVEHSNMDTEIQQDMEVIVTYAATTFLDVRTTGGTADGMQCPSPPYAMDGGQTDRHRP